MPISQDSMMIDIVANKVTNRGKEEDIQRFEVWFMTPFGLTDDRVQAINRCILTDLDPATCIRPVSVAITETTYEVCGA